MSVEGLEPATNGLKGHCSTIELHAHLRVGFYHAPFIKSTGEDRRQETGDGRQDGSLCSRPGTEDG